VFPQIEEQLAPGALVTIASHTNSNVCAFASDVVAAFGGEPRAAPRHRTLPPARRAVPLLRADNFVPPLTKAEAVRIETSGTEVRLA